MAIGFGLLGLEPRAFWSLTLAELDAAVRGRLGGVRSDRPPVRSELTALMKRFPDLED
jgi:uncharacterized phage protein (TIGR02216 family)